MGEWIIQTPTELCAMIASESVSDRETRGNICNEFSRSLCERRKLVSAREEHFLARRKTWSWWCRQKETREISLRWVGTRRFLFIFIEQRNDRHEAQGDDWKPNWAYAVVNFDVVTQQTNSAVASDLDGFRSQVSDTMGKGKIIVVQSHQFSIRNSAIK